MTKRLRIFAGPNGSGKSTMIRLIEVKCSLHQYINADEIEAELKQNQSLNFNQYNILVDENDFLLSIRRSPFTNKSSILSSIADSLRIKSNQLILTDPAIPVNSYFAAFLSEYIRNKLLAEGQSYTIETVMSDKRKIEYIQSARQKGYKIYLYFVTTKSVEINIERVRQRVKQGGHDVPEEKIRIRYDKSLDNLYDALLLSDRAYLFDNSGENVQLLAEYEKGNISILSEYIPSWFDQYILGKIKQ